MWHNWQRLDDLMTANYSGVSGQMDNPEEGIRGGGAPDPPFRHSKFYINKQYIIIQAILQITTLSHSKKKDNSN